MPTLKDERAHTIRRKDRHDRADDGSVAVSPHSYSIDLQRIEEFQEIIGMLPVKVGVEPRDVRRFTVPAPIRNDQTIIVHQRLLLIMKAIDAQPPAAMNQQKRVTVTVRGIVQ